MTDVMPDMSDFPPSENMVDILKEILESLGKLHAKIDNSGIVKGVEDVIATERVFRA